MVAAALEAAGQAGRGARDAAPGGARSTRRQRAARRSWRARSSRAATWRPRREYLTVETAGDDPELLLTVADIQLRGDNVDDGLAIVRRLLEEDASRREQIALLGWSVAEQAPGGRLQRRRARRRRGGRADRLAGAPPPRCRSSSRACRITSRR